MWYHNRYVWIPEDVDARWRPYTEGRWVYSRRHGWTWVSSEPFGWATYHYGRWGFSNRIGWFWVPGTRWAPAWVSWRQSDDYLAWAPLPPTYDRGPRISIGSESSGMSGAVVVANTARTRSRGCDGSSTRECDEL